MSVRSFRAQVSGQCVRRQDATTSEGIWITNCLLARAFERYCAVSTATRRHVSFVPGPLESRRRLGRRHATDLYSFQSQASLAPWALDMPKDLDKWVWQAPSLFADGKDEAASPREPEPKISRSWSQFLGDVPIWSGIWDDATEKSPGESFYGDSELLVSKIRTAQDDSLRTHFAAFLARMQQHAGDGHLTTHHVHHVLNTLPGHLLQRPGSEALLGDVLSSLCTVIASSSGALLPHHFEARFWSCLLAEVSFLNGEGNACDVFEQVMLLVPEQHLNSVLASAYLVLASISRPRGKPCLPPIHRKPGLENELPFQDKAAALSRGLARLSFRKHRKIFEGVLHANGLALGSPDSRTLGVFWLSVLARCPKVPSQWLFGVMHGLFRNRPQQDRLSDIELCQLLTLDCMSHGILSEPAGLAAMLPLCEGKLATESELVLARFAQAVCVRLPRKSQMGVLTNLCRMLHSTGRMPTLIRSLEALATTPETLSARPLAMVAKACNDHRLALTLYTITTEYPHKFYGGAKGVAKVWDWRLWSSYMETLMEDESVDRRQLRALLHIKPHWRPRGDGYRSSPSETSSRFTSPDDLTAPRTASKRTVVAIEETAMQITKCLTRGTPGTFDRTGLYLVRNRIQYLTRHGVKLSPRILNALAHLVTRDLANGQPGRGSLFRWLLDLIATHQGPEAASTAGQELFRWREVNRMLRRGE